MSRIFRSRVITALVLLGLTSCIDEFLAIPDVPNDTHDLFPLTVGSRFTYSVLYDSLSRQGYPQGAWRDSGNVEYHVRDSTITASATRQWTVDEVRHLLHYSWRFNVFDSVLVSARWEDTTVTLILFEQLGGFHEVRCEGLVWSFPIKDTRSSVSLGWDTTIALFRYACDATRVLAAQDIYSGGAVTISDSINLDSSLGMISRRTFRSGWAVTAPQARRTILLSEVTFDRHAFK